MYYTIEFYIYLCYNMVCNKDNIGSAKSIIKNGDILENEININGMLEQRYWIHINSL